MTDWFAPSNAVWLRKRDLDMNVTGPVFDYKGKEYTVQSSKECRIWLLDTSALGGEDHRTPVYRTPLVCNEEVQFAAAGVWGALSTWEDTERHALGADAVLGAEALEVHTRRSSTARSCRARSRRSSSKRQNGKVAARAGVALAQHGPGRSGRDRQRRGVRLRQRRGRDAGDVRHRPRLQHGGESRRALDARDALRARRAHRRGAVVERRSDHVVQPLHAACRWRTAASTSAPTTASSMRSASTEPTASTK